MDDHGISGSYGVQLLVNEKARLETEQTDTDDRVAHLQKELDRAKTDQHNISRDLADVRNTLKNLGVEGIK